MKNNIKKIIIYWIIFAAIIILLFGAYIFFGNSRYFSDSLYVLYKDDDNSDKALFIELTKYNILPNLYHHSYSVKLIGKNLITNAQKYENNSISGNFKAAGFLKRIINKNNENILNENYRVSIEINNKRFDIDLENLTSDFLINNSLERFTYINMGTAMIAINGKKYQADFVLNKTASTNYGKLIKSQAVKSKGTVVFLSDNQGGLYYADITSVFGEGKGTDYQSHSWAINKNDKILKKDVGERIAISFAGDKSFIVNLPAFNNARIKIKQRNGQLFGNTFYNLLNGELIDDFGEKIITGLSTSYDDSE